jgi:dTDP-4-amino-4,6-dideoxygalactose transaminase/CelD/BcsL family acetyltransferase involved in cellulose biosynthesis
MYVSTWPALNPLLFVQEKSSCKTPFPFYAPHKTYGYLARSLIYHLFRALEIKPGETVLVPDYHHSNEVEAIKAAGANLRFYRVDRSMQPDLEDIEKKCTPDVRALFAIHYIGWPAPLEQLAAIAKSKNIPLIEDCALSMFTEDSSGRPIGTTGDYSIFCLYKSLPVPNGGLLVQNRNILPALENLALRPCDSTSLVGRSLELGLETLTTHSEPLGRSLMAMKRAVGSVLNAAHVKRANVGDVGFDFDRADLAISPMCHRLLERVDFESIPEKRRILYAQLADRLRGRSTYLFEEAQPGTSPLFFPLLVNDKKSAVDELNKRGIGAVQFWNHGHPEVDPETSADAQYLRNHVIELPIHQDVSLAQLDYIADAVLALGLGLEDKQPVVPVTADLARVTKIESAMTVDLIHGTIDAVLGLREEWSQLLEEGQSQEIFYRPEWISAYLRAFEPNADVFMITARRKGKLRALLPLVDEWSTIAGLPARKLRFPANIHSTRADLVRGTGDGGLAVRAIWERLKTLDAWHALELRDVPEDGSGQSLLRFAEEEKFPVGRWESMQSPYIDLSAESEVSSKFRANLRRRWRNLEARGDLMLRRIDHADPQMLGAFYELERAGWKGEEGSAIAQSDNTRQYYEEIAQLAASRGELALYSLEHKGQPIAMHFGLESHGRYSLLKPAYDENFREYSPGQLLMDKVIADSRRRNLHTFDFLGMSMPWKLDWTKKVRRHHFCYVFRDSSYGAALRAAKFDLVPLAKQALAA